ncbi:hypothetical protein EMEDMD4_790324 [Sinorhizobium medicae]|uniref:Uncharacterized protein n=1 Tax=Sinorhizobium medicae TaxID=110321 RepID=A0A508X6X3_9HYPH|nr:hypothetical protein EMEDMD4_790324 [Sinorhizobium medicae]
MPVRHTRPRCRRGKFIGCFSVTCHQEISEIPVLRRTRLHTIRIEFFRGKAAELHRRCCGCTIGLGRQDNPVRRRDRPPGRMDLEDRCSLYQRQIACGISIELALPVVPDLAAPRNFNPIGNKSGADPILECDGQERQCLRRRPMHRLVMPISTGSLATGNGRSRTSPSASQPALHSTAPVMAMANR